MNSGLFLKMLSQRNSFGRTESEAPLFKLLKLVLNQLNLKKDAAKENYRRWTASKKIKNLHFNTRSPRSPPPKRHQLYVGGSDKLTGVFPSYRKQRPADKTLACRLH